MVRDYGFPLEGGRSLDRGARRRRLPRRRDQEVQARVPSSLTPPLLPGKAIPDPAYSSPPLRPMSRMISSRHKYTNNKPYQRTCLFTAETCRLPQLAVRRRLKRAATQFTPECCISIGHRHAKIRSNGTRNPNDRQAASSPRPLQC